eukprot:jgi/Mesen1/2503/ME000159S01625
MGVQALRRAACPSNQPLVDFLGDKREGVDVEKPNLRNTFSKAIASICSVKEPIATTHEAKRVKSKQEGREWMRKEELIDAANQSGLAKHDIWSNSAGVNQPASASMGSAESMYYTGWSCMSTLVKKALVLKFSNPAKYQLTEAGHEVAVECMKRSGLLDSAAAVAWLPLAQEAPPAKRKASRSLPVPGSSSGGGGTDGSPAASTGPLTASTSGAQPAPPRQQEQAPAPPTAAAAARNRKRKVPLDSAGTGAGDGNGSNFAAGVDDTWHEQGRWAQAEQVNAAYERSMPASAAREELPRPPVAFEQAYDVVLLVDHREQFQHTTRDRTSLDQVVEKLRVTHSLTVEVRSLPVGDVMWLARHRHTRQEYVLDYVLERKRVDDLWASIKEKRFKDQKLRMLKSGLRHVALHTEVEDGINVLRTEGVGPTVAMYAQLTAAIKSRYASRPLGTLGSASAEAPPPVSMTFEQYKGRCQASTVETVQDIFASMLLQVKNVTEDVALAIVGRYPTLASLTKAYQKLEGDVVAQQNLLVGVGINDKKISETISKRIFDLIWA